MGIIYDTNYDVSTIKYGHIRVYNHSVLNFKLQVGQNHDTDSPCSLKIIPKHFGHCPISSSTNFRKFVQT